MVCNTTFLYTTCNAPINVNPEGGLGKGWGFDIFTKKMTNATPSGQNSWAKFPTPGMKLYSRSIRFLVHSIRQVIGKVVN